MISPKAVRSLLEGDNLEKAEAAQANGKGTLVMIPDAECDQALRELVGDRENLVTCIDDLAGHTVLGGRNDPTTFGSDRPWRSLIFRLLKTDKKGARQAARTWNRVVLEAAFEGDPPYLVRAMAAYVWGIVEAYFRNDKWAEHGLAAGTEEVEMAGNITNPFLAACRFVRTAVREGELDIISRAEQLLRDVGRTNVRARWALGHLLLGYDGPLSPIAKRLGLTSRVLYHARTVCTAFTREEVEDVLSGTNPPPWSAFVILSAVTPKSRRGGLLAEWMAKGLSMREFKRRIRSKTGHP